jgi:shikimate dehydrogenase
VTFLSLLTGSFSTPAAENPTVAMVEAAYRAMNLDARYINCDVAPEQLEAAVNGARAMGWRGFNCSLPHKVAVIAHLDGLGHSAEMIGAVNCVVDREGKWIGENTDGQGFVSSLKTVIDPNGKRMVILGAGGAARAIAVESKLAGVSEITIVNRNRARGEELASLVEGSYVPWDGRYTVGQVDIVVNATSIGLAPDPNTPDVDGLRAGLVVADVIPNPPRTRLIEQAQHAGATTLDGIGMLVNQAVIAIRHWTGQDPDPALMRATVEKLFA